MARMVFEAIFIAPESMSAACYSLCARWVGPSFIFVVRAIFAATAACRTGVPLLERLLVIRYGEQLRYRHFMHR